MKPIRIATRASRLALAQTQQVCDALRSLYPDVSCSIVEISTQGDRDKSDFLYARSAVGFFTSEVERALLENRADLAVHSLKDLPTTITEGLVIAAIPKRQAVHDTLIAATPLLSLDDLPKGARVGTSSLRRITQLKLMRADLDCHPLRGNVETRLGKVRNGTLDAIVVAQAGLNRLGLADPRQLVLKPEEFIPAPGQGALAVQIRTNDTELYERVRPLDDAQARLTSTIERRILAGLHGGCSVPLGVFAKTEGKIMHIHAVLCDLTSRRHIRKNCSCPIDTALETADRITAEILDEGGRELLEAIRRDKEKLG